MKCAWFSSAIDYVVSHRLTPHLLGSHVALASSFAERISSHILKTSRHRYPVS